MSNSIGKPVMVIPGDEPPQMQGSAQLDRIKEYGNLTMYTDRPGSKEEQLRRVKDADIILNTRGAVKWGRAEMEQLPKLKLIATCSIGTDMIDLEAARDLGITVCNQPGRTAKLVAEHAFALMLAVAKRLAYQTSQLKRGVWAKMDNVYLQGKTLGVVGTGDTGAEMARLGNAFGMRVVAWTFNPNKERAKKLGVAYVPLDELLRESDVVSLHVRLSDESRHLIGKKELAMMKEGALLVNVARGEVVDTAALVEALNSGHLGGAGIDVFDKEPIGNDAPIVQCEQVVLTPHIAEVTPEGVE
ncbi:MAG: 2-hydroxyacid dehydrogenase, partial [Chloroflexi bacterium]|nr:2-hydroxyacid dehydrogenase [Chloroflexota bacterium]